MPEIRQLPPGVVNKIAAGEVIERPASVVKELMENAVDAGATRVDVFLEKGGGELLRVADDGCGIAADQLSLAIASHATSKIRDADDLFQVDTLGFRGEALASIAEVSQLLIRSRTRDAEAGSELEVVGGLASPLAPAGCPVGTIVEVRQLFFNTPVRRRFLRKPQTEMGHALESFTRIALVHPQIHFTMRHNERTVHDLPPVDNWRERIVALFGSELADSLIRVDGRDEDRRVRGYVADPSVSRANNKMQYLFLNGRHIRDRSLQHALGEAYRGLLLTGRCPVAFLRLDIPADTVDVNVHPTKLEVRFQDGGRLYSLVLGAIRDRFLSTDLTARVQGEADPAPLPGTADAGHQQQHIKQVIRWARGESAAEPERAESVEEEDEPGAMGQADQPRFRLSAPPAQRQGHFDLDDSRSQAGTAPFKPFDTDRPTSLTPGGRGEAPSDESAGKVVRVDRPVAPNGLQLHNRYLVTQNEEGMVIIDQHALHERILYERLRNRILDGALESQRLLVPETVTLTASEASVAIDSRELLAQLGIEIEAFGGDTVAVSSYPAMLANIDPGELLRQVMEQLVAGGKAPDRRDLLDELLHMIACKAAIKAGDRLSAEEIDSLLEQRDLCQDAHHCPHGRPAALVFTKEELDRRFKRI